MNLELVYKSKIIEVKNKNKELQLLDLNCINYEEILEKIEEETSKEIEEEHQSLNAIYEKALKRLDVLNDQLTMEYEYCYKQIKKKSKILNEKLDNIEDNEIQNIITDIQKLLLQMKKIPAINYDENKKLAEEIYELVYSGIKLELEIKNDSQLLEKVKTDATDISNIAKLIKEDISKESEKNKQEEIQKKVQKINQKGSSNIYYLDEELIVLLTSKKDETLISNEEQKILKKIGEYENTKKELEDRKLVYSYYDEKIPKLKSKIKQTKKRIRGRKIVLTVNLGLVGGLMAVSFISQPKNIKYKTITTVYDSSTDNISSDIKYLPEAEDTVTVVEYQPWEEYNFFDTQYKRNVYTYKLDAVNMNYDDIKDYLTSDFKEEVIPTKEEEKNTSKPNDEYKESEYIITKQIQDKDDYNEWDMLSMSFGLMIYLYGGMFWSGFSIGRPSLEELIKILKENKINLKCAKQASLDYKELIEKFYNEISALKTSIEVDYEKLPIALKENEKIKRKVLTIKEDNIEK